MMRDSPAPEPIGRAKVPKRSLARRLWPYLVFALLVAGYIQYEFVSSRRAVPPPDVQTLDDFLRWHPDTDRFYVLSTGDQQYLCAYRPGPGLTWSGPSAYAFDAAGRLVDWTRDSGEDPRFQATWHTLGPGRRLDADAARRWVSPRSDAGRRGGESPG